MQEFKISEDRYKEITKATLIKAVPIMVLAMSAGITISYVNTKDQQNEINIFPYMIPFMILLMAFTMYRAVKRQMELLKSYRLIIENNTITREQYNTPTITIPIEKLNGIVKNPNGSFTIKGSSSFDVIVVPQQIVGYDELEKSLAEMKTISAIDTLSVLEKFRGLIVTATLGMMVAVYISHNKIVIGLCGTILLIALSYSFLQLQKNKNVDAKTKVGLLFILIVIASVIGTMYFKLTA
ncbi:MAG: hypothetical protein QM710_04075 [Flavobacterium sp.]